MQFPPTPQFPHDPIAGNLSQNQVTHTVAHAVDQLQTGLRPTTLIGRGAMIGYKNIYVKQKSFLGYFLGFLGSRELNFEPLNNAALH